MKKILFLYIGLIGLMSLTGCSNETVNDAKKETVQPHIYPDYLGVTIPVNIAPLNFSMADEAALRIDAVITDRHGHNLHSQGEESVDFDLEDWHQLLSQNRGDSLSVTVSAKYDDGWHTYRSFSLYVSPDSIDYGICYRLIAPGHEVWSKMGIYERDLSSFDERPLIENTQFEGCVNCHSFNRGNPANMSLHIRGKHGATLLSKDDGSITAYNTKTDQTLGLCVYPYWHPSGRYIAYSTNTTKQTFHSAHPNRIEVFDESKPMSCCFRPFSSKTPSMRPIPSSRLTAVRSISAPPAHFQKETISSTPSAIISAASTSIPKRGALAIVSTRLSMPLPSPPLLEGAGWEAPYPSLVLPTTDVSFATRSPTMDSSASGIMRPNSICSILPQVRAVL